MKRIEMEVSGGCQCGAVRYHATAMHDNSHLCHCRMCQKASGNIFAALVAAPDDALSWTRGKPSIWKSSELVERGFCANCGTPLFFHHLENGRTNLMMVRYHHGHRKYRCDRKQRRRLGGGDQGEHQPAPRSRYRLMGGEGA